MHSHLPFRVSLLVAILVPLSSAAWAQSGARTISWKRVLDQESDWYASAEAVRIADNVLRYQHANGGWPKNIDMARVLSEADRERIRAEQAEGGTTLSNTTIDNGATYTQMRYLARLFQATGHDRFARGVLRGVDYLLAAQYDNGGWPQYYPFRGGYYDHVTFNDGAMIGVLSVLRDIAAGAPPFAFVDAERRAEAEAAVARGIDIILRTQIRQNGRLAVWGAQYDEETLEPAWARAYEPPSLSGSESVGVVRFLMALEEPSPAVIEAIEAAVAWFRHVAVHGYRIEAFVGEDGQGDKRLVRDPNAGPLWARFYELVTNRPLFLDRDSVYRYALSEIDRERRAGYAYYGGWAEEVLREEYPTWRSKRGLDGEPDSADLGDSGAAPTPNDAPVPSAATLRVYLDCDGCDFDDVRRQIPFVTYVRNPEEADVHLFITDDATGSGGRQYKLSFLGRGDFESVEYTFEQFVGPGATAAERREAVNEAIRIGLVPYLVQTDPLDDFSLDYAGDDRSAPALEPIDDPWNHWVFEAYVGDIILELESNRTVFDSRWGLYADHVSEDWKLRLRPYFNYDFVRIERDGEPDVTSNISRHGFDSYAIRSLSPHWSAGLFGTYVTRNDQNIRHRIEVAPGVEYSVLPYEEATRRAITVVYQLGVTYADYFEETIFEKTEETLLSQELSASVAIRQPWGEIHSGLEGSHYFHDFTKARAEFFGVVSVRLLKGLSLNLEGEFLMIRDQLALPGGGATLEEILLQQRELATDFELSGAIALSYTFGSSFANIVNTRF